MSGKFKRFSDLSTRQKRRRLLTIRENRHHIEQNVDDSPSDESTLDVNERLEGEEMDEAPLQKKRKSTANIDEKLNFLKTRLEKLKESRILKDFSLVELNKSTLSGKQLSMKGTVANSAKIVTSRSSKLSDNSSSIIFDEALPILTSISEKSLEGHADKNVSEGTFLESSRLENCSLHKSVLKELQEVKEQNKTIMEQLKLVLEKEQAIFEQNYLILKEFEGKNAFEMKKLSQTLLEPLTGFPLHTVDEFLQLDAEESTDKRRKLYTHLVNLGGSKLREFLNSAVRETMTDELVCKFSWIGGEHSRKFGDTKVANVLFQAAKKCSHFRGPCDKGEFKNHMKEVLRCTKQRFRKNFKKNLLNDTVNLQVESTEEEILIKEENGPTFTGGA